MVNLLTWLTIITITLVDSDSTAFVVGVLPTSTFAPAIGLTLTPVSRDLFLGFLGYRPVSAIGPWRTARRLGASFIPLRHSSTRSFIRGARTIFAQNRIRIVENATLGAPLAPWFYPSQGLHPVRVCNDGLNYRPDHEPTDYDGGVPSIRIHPRNRIPPTYP